MTPPSRRTVRHHPFHPTRGADPPEHGADAWLV